MLVFDGPSNDQSGFGVPRSLKYSLAETAEYVNRVPVSALLHLFRIELKLSRLILFGIEHIAVGSLKQKTRLSDRR